MRNFPQLADAVQRRAAPVILHPPPGLCLLRRLSVTGLGAREIEAALALWAEESLPEPVQHYYLDSWVIDDDSRALAALPREPLDRAREQLAAGGGRLAGIRVAELRPPATDAGSFYRYMPTLVTSEYHHYFHTDLETPETVPWTGLEASTRAYARIVDEVNKLPLSALKRPDMATNNNQQ